LLLSKHVSGGQRAQPLILRIDKDFGVLEPLIRNLLGHLNRMLQPFKLAIKFAVQISELSLLPAHQKLLQFGDLRVAVG
jgi:hypothetical protein